LVEEVWTKSSFAGQDGVLAMLTLCFWDFQPIFIKSNGADIQASTVRKFPRVFLMVIFFYRRRLRLIENVFRLLSMKSRAIAFSPKNDIQKLEWESFI